jgi:spore germination protein KC
MKRNMILLIGISLLLTGCWDQRELSTITIVTGMAIDKGKNGNFKLTIESINETELYDQTATGNSPSVLFSLEGETIAELAYKMNIGFSKSVIYSHMRTLVVSEAIAESGMMEFLDTFERSRELRDDFDVILAKEGEAADILQVVYTFQKSSSLKIMSQLESATKGWGSTPNVKVKDLISALTSPGRQPVMTAVRIQGKPKKGESVDNMKKTRPDAIVVIDSMALFKGEKLVGFLSVEDTRNYLWTQNQIENTSISIPCGGNQFAAIRITDSKTTVKGRIKNGKPKIGVDIVMEGAIYGSTCKGHMDDPKTYKKLDELTNQYVREKVSKTIQTVQDDYGVDIFGFGEVVYRQDYKQFKKVADHWDEAFKDAEIDVSVDTMIRRAGLRTNGVFDRMK